MSEHLPNLDTSLFKGLPSSDAPEHMPRILLLYGSTRERSFSRLMVEEAARLLEHFGAQVRIFNPSGLPLPDDAPVEHPKVQELRELVLWSEGQVWCSPERHGAMSDASLWWLAVLQCGQPTACVGPLDAHVHYSQSVFGPQGLYGIRRQRSDEAISVLRPARGCDGRTGQIHPVVA